MQSVVERIESVQKKSSVVDVKSGDTVRVHQKVVEGGKERTQVFEGLIIRASRKKRLTSTFTVRRVSNGVGVEKTFLIHSPSILKVEVVRRSKVRRNRLNYMRKLSGRGTRLSGIEFDRDAVNAVQDQAAAAEEERIRSEQLESYDPSEAEAAKAEAKAAKSQGAEESKKSEMDKNSDQLAKNTDKTSTKSEAKK